MESKCPVCIAGTLENWNRRVRQCDSCDFRCDTEDLARIAAAMQLALAHAWEAEQSRKGLAHRTRHKRAVKRVLEVFGGANG